MDCRNVKDKADVLDELEQGVGFVKCNTQVIGLLREALVAQGRAALARLPAAERGASALLGNLGQLLQMMGQLEEARPLLEEAVQMGKETLGDRHPHTLVYAKHLKLLLASEREAAAAQAEVAAQAAANKALVESKSCGIQDTKPWEHPPLNQLSIKPANRQRESTMERALVDGQPETTSHITSPHTDASHALSGPGSKFMVLKIDADEDAAKITGISLSLRDKDPPPGPYGPYTVRFVGRQILRWSITPTDGSIKMEAMEALASGESRWHFTNWSRHCKLEVDFKPSSETSLCIEWFNRNEFKHFPLNDIMVRY